MNILYFVQSLNLLWVKLYCLLQGIFVNEDAGQFRFEILVPNLDKKGKHYKIDYIVVSPNDTILIPIFFYSQWGFLNNWLKQEF